MSEVNIQGKANRARTNLAQNEVQQKNVTTLYLTSLSLK